MLTNEKDLIPKADQTLSVNEAGEVATVLHPPTGHIFVINGVARRIIELCDGQRKISDIKLILLEEFVVASPEKVNDDIKQFLTKAFHKKLVSWC